MKYYIDLEMEPFDKFYKIYRDTLGKEEYNFNDELKELGDIQIKKEKEKEGTIRWYHKGKLEPNV